MSPGADWNKMTENVKTVEIVEPAETVKTVETVPKVESVQTFTDGNFDAAVLKAATPVLVDFWAEWCGPCKRLAPTVDALAADYTGKVTFGKLNVDENPDTAIKFNVRGIPALLLFKGGQLVDQVVGLQPKDEIKKVIDRHL
jgi:thioredoxin 1